MSPNYKQFILNVAVSVLSNMKTWSSLHCQAGGEVEPAGAERCAVREDLGTRMP